MGILVYFVALVVTAAIAMFGFDLLVQPLPRQPMTGIVSIGAPTRPAVSAADNLSLNQDSRAADRALTPIYPTNLGGPKSEIQQPPENAAVGNTGNIASAAPHDEHAMACNIEVCASIYRSFRASDCTYQPFDGDMRRQCDK
jgi:hypothetical protein